MTKRRKLTEKELQWAENLKRLWTARAPDQQTGKKISQERAAELMGWDAQSTVSQYINGVIPLNTDAILGFASLIPCQPQEINPDLELIGSGQLSPEDAAFLRRYLQLTPQNKKTVSAVANSLPDEQDR